MGGTALSSLGLDGVSVFDGAGDDVSGFGALVSAWRGTSGGGGACSSFLGCEAFILD